jgi:hypothetical protein
MMGDKANRKTVRATKVASSLTDEEEQQLENKLVREANRVALKVMTERDQFERELSVRELDASPGEWWGMREYASSKLNEAHVVNVIRSHKVNQLICAAR